MKLQHKVLGLITLILSAFTIICLVMSLSACGADSGTLSHGNAEMSATEGAEVKKTAKTYFRQLYAGQGRKALEYASQDCTNDHNLADKYATFQSMARIEKKFDNKLGNTNLETIEKSIEQGSVKQGDNASSAVLVTDALVDLGFANESSSWKVDHSTAKSVIEGGFLKE
ncbi:hypothetical protein KIMH_07680 [Bombiscardovia apis]|uniref:Lipoprotein n=1 Tax=Bombiscardovia apis TaxID=2932182 RepID=A0ABN6SF58_9BIFI|nr:hypothetical protein [Bombiscardovia apis]BDR54657.1 hypothetical protein KIMH_07680 [Bombiscardovia apis]